MGNAKSKQEEVVYEISLDDWPWLWAIWDSECLDWKRGLDDDEIQETALRQAKLPVPIITDSLYVGNAFSVSSIETLKDNGITAVLNMAGPMALKRKTIQAYRNNGIQYKRIDGLDEDDYPLLQKHWLEASDFITFTTKNGGKCVVHCVAGRNRSVLIVAAYYMLSKRTNVLETVQHVRKQRGNIALWNEGFQAQLVALARKHDLLGPAPGTDGSIVTKIPPPSNSITPQHWALAKLSDREI